MATLEDTGAPAHDRYVKWLAEKLTSHGWVLESPAVENADPSLRHNLLEESLTWSLPILERRLRPDLEGYHKSCPGMWVGFDAKTTHARKDTGNVAIELWALYLAACKGYPIFYVFRDVGHRALASKECMPLVQVILAPKERWSEADHAAQQALISEVPCLKRVPLHFIPWRRDVASGDYLVLIKEQDIRKFGHPLETLYQPDWLRELQLHSEPAAGSRHPLSNLLDLERKGGRRYRQIPLF